MKLIFKTVFLLVLLAPLILVSLLLLAPQQQSLVENIPTLTHQDVKKARALLSQHDPRKLQTGAKKTLRLDEQSLTLLGTYGIQSLHPQLAAAGMQANLNDNNLLLKFSVRLPENPLGRFFNLQFSLEKHDSQLNIQSLQIGRWHIPDWASAYIPSMTGALLQQDDFWQLFQAALVNYQFTQQALVIDYRWRSEWERVTKAKIRELTDHASMIYYAGFLTELPFNQRASFATIITTLFKQASVRSIEFDPVAENRAVLQLLGQWALGKQTYGQTYLPYFSARLQRRTDLAQHFLVSAAIASQSNTELSNLIGTGKEMYDSDGGSGFSFSDLAADRAGSLLGKLATQDKTSALKVQKLLSDTQYSNGLLADVSSLPAPLTEQQFLQQYGNIRDPRYEKLLIKIDGIISSSSFFQQILQ